MALTGGARWSLLLAQGARSFSSSSVAYAAKAPIQVYGLEGRYAHALFSAASSKNCVNEVEADLERLDFKRGTVFTNFLMNPAEAKATKLRILDDALQAVKCNEITRGFIRTVTEKNRVRKIEGMVKAYKTIMFASRGEVSCVVTTATTPDKKTLDEIQKILSGFVQKGQKITMDVKVDPAIIGGMVVQIGDRFCDMSVATKVRRLTDTLSTAV